MVVSVTCGSGFELVRQLIIIKIIMIMMMMMMT